MAGITDVFWEKIMAFLPQWADDYKNHNSLGSGFTFTDLVSSIF